MVYCVVPIALVLVTLSTSLYCFLNRRNKDSRMAAPRRVGTIFSPVSSSVKKEYQPISRQTPQSSLISNGNNASNGSKSSTGVTTAYSMNPTATHSSSMHSFPREINASQLPQHCMINSPASFYNYSGLQTLSNQPTYWHPPAPSVATETSFDQYSAIMGNSSKGDLAMDQLQSTVIQYAPKAAQSPRFAFQNV